ncbi:hypothetical protein REPUB_Repub02eG0010100 [Reevesia pubescens]
MNEIGAVVFVDNLPANASALNLRNLFSTVGEIVDVFISKKKSRTQKFFGFIKFAKLEDAWFAIKEFNGRHVSGYSISLNTARYNRQRKPIRVHHNSRLTSQQKAWNKDQPPNVPRNLVGSDSRKRPGITFKDALTGGENRVSSSTELKVEGGAVEWGLGVINIASIAWLQYSVVVITRLEESIFSIQYKCQELKIDFVKQGFEEVSFDELDNVIQGHSPATKVLPVARVPVVELSEHGEAGKCLTHCPREPTQVLKVSLKPHAVKSCAQLDKPAHSDHGAGGSSNSFLGKDPHNLNGPSPWDGESPDTAANSCSVVGPSFNLDHVLCLEKLSDVSGPSEPPGFEFKAHKGLSKVDKGKRLALENKTAGCAKESKGCFKIVGGNPRGRKKLTKPCSSLSSLLLLNKARKPIKRRRNSLVDDKETSAQDDISNPDTPTHGNHPKTSVTAGDEHRLSPFDFEGDKIAAVRDSFCEIEARETWKVGLELGLKSTDDSKLIQKLKVALKGDKAS